MNRKAIVEKIERTAREEFTGLDLSFEDISCLPEEIGQLCSLQWLYIRSTDLKSLPAGIGQLTALRKLVLSNNQLKSLPPEIGQLASLRRLKLEENRLTSLPAEIAQLTELRELDLFFNKLSSLPAQFGRLTALQDLNLSMNKLSSLPSGFGQLTNLKRLDLSYNKLSSLPPEFGQLTALQDLNLSKNKLSSLPSGFGQFPNLKRLDLSNNRLESLPEEIFQLNDLKEIDLSHNQLSSLPVDIVEISERMHVNLVGNRIAHPLMGHLNIPPGEKGQSSSYISVPLLNLALDIVLFPTTKEISRVSFDIVRFTSGGKTLRLDATDGARIWGAEIEVELSTFQCLIPVDDCKAIKSICLECVPHESTITIEASDEVVSFETSEEEKFEVCLIDKGSQEFPPLEKDVETRIESLNPSLDPIESRRHALIAESLLRKHGWVKAAWDSIQNTVPTEFLIVEHRGGELMSTPLYWPRTLSSHQHDVFVDGLRKWLTEKSKEMKHASLAEMATLIRTELTQAPPAGVTCKRGKRLDFKGRIKIFESLREYAEWSTLPQNLVPDAIYDDFISEGFPIYVVVEYPD